MTDFWLEQLDEFQCHLLKYKRQGGTRLFVGQGNEELCFGHVRDEMPMRQSNNQAVQVVVYMSLEFRVELLA